MDPSQFVKLGFEIAGGLVALAAMIYGAVGAISKMRLGARKDDRAHSAESELFTEYKGLIDKKGEEIARMRGTVEQLMEAATNQHRRILELQLENNVARTDRADLVEQLRKIKVVQANLLESGAITRPFVEGLTEFLDGGH